MVFTCITSARDELEQDSFVHHEPDEHDDKRVHNGIQHKIILTQHINITHNEHKQKVNDEDIECCLPKWNEEPRECLRRGKTGLWPVNITPVI
jgi:hypothetical protein